MREEIPIVYPYIPNSEPSIKKEMLEVVGATSVEEFFADVPENLRLRKN